MLSTIIIYSNEADSRGSLFYSPFFEQKRTSSRGFTVLSVNLRNKNNSSKYTRHQTKGLHRKQSQKCTASPQRCTVRWQLFTRKYIVMWHKLGRLDSRGILTISCFGLSTIVHVQQETLSLLNALYRLYELCIGNIAKQETRPFCLANIG